MDILKRVLRLLRDMTRVMNKLDKNDNNVRSVIQNIKLIEKLIIKAIYEYKD